MNNHECCPLCGSATLVKQEVVSGDELNTVYKRAFGINQAVRSNVFDYCNCTSCDLSFFLPMETGGEDLYESLQHYDWYYMTNKSEYSIAKKYLPTSGKVLEIGAGKAAFASIVGQDRYVGLEFNDKAIERARNEGINLIKQSVEDHSRTHQKYDAVVSFQVLEHVKDPKGFIVSSLDCLNSGGRLIVAVPANDGFAGKSLNNILDMPPHHVTHWSSTSLRKLADQNNLRLLSIEYEPVAKYHRLWAKRIPIENRLRKAFGLKPKLLDLSFKSKVLSYTARMLAMFLPIRINTLGHTVVAVYEKK